MFARTFRPLFLAVALAMALGGAVAILHTGEKQAAADSDLTIDIIDSGMNPVLCQLGRFNTVHWRNKTGSVRKILFDNLSYTDPITNQTTPLSTDDIAPGANSSGVTLSAGGNYAYHDVYNPNLKGSLSAPQRSDTGPIVCSPLPPTPTPSPTPKVTPTPIIPPTPTPAPRHPRCTGLLGCAVAPGVASDD